MNHTKVAGDLVGALLFDESDSKRGTGDLSPKSVTTTAIDDLTDADGAIAAIRQQLIVKLRASA